MKKRLILTILTALLFGACSNQNEVSQNETEKPVGFVQKEEKAKKEQEKADKHNTLTDADVRRILRDEFVSAGGFMKDNDFSLRNNRSL